MLDLSKIHLLLLVFFNTLMGKSKTRKNHRLLSILMSEVLNAPMNSGVTEPETVFLPNYSHQEFPSEQGNYI